MASLSPTGTAFTDTDYEDTDQFDFSSNNSASIQLEDHHYRCLITELEPPTVGTNRSKSNMIKVSDIKFLRPGVFQLEEGCCEWDVSEAFKALIAFAGMHTELRTKTFRDEDYVS
jgi:hypothetical protein